MDTELKERLRHEHALEHDIWAELGGSMPPLDFAAINQWWDALITTPQVEGVIGLSGDRSAIFLRVWQEMLRHSATEEFLQAQATPTPGLCVHVSRQMVPRVWEFDQALSYLSTRVQVGRGQIGETLARLAPFIREHSKAPFEPFGWAKPEEDGYMFWLWENDPAAVKERLLRTHNLLPEACLPYGELRSMMEKLNDEFSASLPAHPASERPALRARRT